MKSFTITLAVLFATVSFAHATATDATKATQDQAVIETTTTDVSATTTEVLPEEAANSADSKIAPATK